MSVAKDVSHTSAGAAEQRAQKSFKPWVTETVAALIQAPQPPADIFALQKAVRAALPKEFKSRKEDIRKQFLFEELYGFYFASPEREQLLTAALKADIPADRLYKNLESLRERVPPRWVVDAKLEEMRGRTHAPRTRTHQALPGILRIARDMPDSELRDIPETTYDKPFHALPGSDGVMFDIGVISAPKIGMPYHVDIWSNLLRCGLSTARKQKCDALVIGGGLFEMVLKKAAGHSRLLTDMVLADKDFDPESVAECYQPEVKRIVESGSLEPIYVTTAEKFAELLRGWFKVSVTPNGKPEFGGPIYIVLGPDDHEIIRKMTNAELAYRQKQDHAKAEADLRYQAKLLVLAEKEGWENIEEIHADHDKASDYVNRTYQTNFSPTQSAKLLKHFTSLFAAKVEDAIPHSTVVDLNNAYMTFGKSAHVFRFYCPTGGKHSFKREVANLGVAQRKGKLADMTVLLHPSATYYRETTRQNYKDGKMLGEVTFVDAPVLIDQAATLEKTRWNRIPLAAVKSVTDGMYNGGMLIASTHPERGVGTKLLTAEMIREIGKTRLAKAPSKMLWVMEDTDWHIGGAMRFRIYRPDGTIIGITEATLEMLQRSGIDRSGAAHIHMYVVADDMLNGNHFGTERSPHYNEQSVARVLQIVTKQQKAAENIRSLKELRAHDAETIKLLAGQLAIRVPHTLTTQSFELFDGVIRPYGDVFKAILMRAKKSNVCVRGISEYTGLPDRRDVGIINFGSGNHAGKTADYMWHEGPNFAEHLRNRFHGDPDVKGFDLDKLICAPVSQRESFGYGTVCVDGKFTYGLHIAATPPKRTSWYDLVEGWVNVNRQRGNPSTILEKMPIVHITGDKHFFAVSYAGGDLYVMGPAATHTDEFAEMAGGLPENNAGVAFIGIPIDGPDSGSIQVVHLKPTEIQEYLSHPDRKIPWGDICPNPA